MQNGKDLKERTTKFARRILARSSKFQLLAIENK